jgi:hypothetical protein
MTNPNFPFKPGDKITSTNWGPEAWLDITAVGLRCFLAVTHNVTPESDLREVTFQHNWDDGTASPWVAYVELPVRKRWIVTTEERPGKPFDYTIFNDCDGFDAWRLGTDHDGRQVDVIVSVEPAE